MIDRKANQGEELRTGVTSFYSVAHHPYYMPPLPLSKTEGFLHKVRVWQQIARLNSSIMWKRMGQVESCWMIKTARQ